ncbi:MAG: lipid-A-disaccharide synthase [Gammaproteobacteria bacterium]|nr:lipid-A-disaccharide synthase [Gammaproteobacteria bacterium]
MTSDTIKVFICAGEVSGDILGANLAKTLLQTNSHITISGMGGQHMQSAGVKLIADADEVSVVGIVEIFKQLSNILKIKKRITQFLQQEKPQLLILIDFSGFNLRLAKQAKKLGIRIMYYVSPQVWAWRAGRIKTIKKYVDHMAVLYAFEEKLYQKHNIPVTFVGHPIVAAAKPTLSKQEVYQKFNLDPNKPIIGLFAGSRRQEIQRMLPTIQQSSELIKKQIPNAQFVLPLATNLSATEIAPQISADIQIIKNHNYDLLQVMDAAVAVSGTITLEIALFKVPLVIFYKGARLSYWIVKALAKVTQIGLCNIIAEKSIAKEFIQSQATPENIANEAIRLLQDKTYRQHKIEQLNLMKQNFITGETKTQVASIAIQLLEN